MDNETLFRRLIREVFSEGRLETADELVAVDAIEHQASGMGNGPDGVKRVASTLRRAFPDFTLEVQDLVSTHDMVWARLRGGGTSLGSFFGHPPTGRTAFVDVFDVGRFANGKLVEHWGVPDTLSMLLQLGLIPAPQRQAEAPAPLPR
jgi:predicted ester cyclase